MGPENKSKPSFKRNLYLIDKRLQLSIALASTAVLMVYALLYTTSVYLLPDENELFRLNGEEMRDRLLRGLLLQIDCG